jgi:O-antigen/teichoic acid export membrane protein
LIIVPLVVTPYISRVLLPEGVGKYSFSFSIITYFTIFGALGFGFYAQREIAKHQNDIEAQSRVFWEINICRLIPIIISLTTNIIICLSGLYKEYTSLMWIFNFNIIALIFDIVFYFQGNENFLKLVLRNVIIKSLSIILIFVFVKKPEDLWKYALINALLVLVSNLSLFIGIHKYIVKVNFKSLRPFRHLPGTLRLFIPTIATSIYTVLDRTLVGLLIRDTYTIIENGNEVVKKVSDLENGYYEQSEKIIKMSLTIITALGSVMIPRNSNEFSLGNIEKVKENIYKTSKIVWLIGIPMTLGFICVSANMVPWFFGDGYDKCIILMQIFSPLILIIGFSNVFGLQYMVPKGEDRNFSVALIIGAFINLILNCILIPFYWSIGAAIASIIAELCVTLIMGMMIKKDISMVKILLSSWKYLIAGIIMSIPCWLLNSYLTSSIINTILIVVTGVLLYVIVLLILKEEIIISTIKKFISKIKKN